MKIDFFQEGAPGRQKLATYEVSAKRHRWFWHGRISRQGTAEVLTVKARTEFHLRRKVKEVIARTWEADEINYGIEAWQDLGA